MGVMAARHLGWSGLRVAKVLRLKRRSLKSDLPDVHCIGQPSKRPKLPDRLSHHHPRHPSHRLST